jgi:hypothetical protein
LLLHLFTFLCDSGLVDADRDVAAILNCDHQDEEPRAERRRVPKEHLIGVICRVVVVNRVNANNDGGDLGSVAELANERVHILAQNDSVAEK